MYEGCMYAIVAKNARGELLSWSNPRSVENCLATMDSYFNGRGEEATEFILIQVSGPFTYKSRVIRGNFKEVSVPVRKAVVDNYYLE